MGEHHRDAALISDDTLSQIPRQVTSDCRSFAERVVKVSLCRFGRLLFRLAFRQAPRFGEFLQVVGRSAGVEASRPEECDEASALRIIVAGIVDYYLDTEIHRRARLACQPTGSRHAFCR
jgi:hypothetical protein